MLLPETACEFGNAGLDRRWVNNEADHCIQSPPELPLGLDFHSIENEFERLVSRTWRTVHIFSFSHNTTMGFELNTNMVEILKKVRPDVHVFTNKKETARELHRLFSRVSPSVAVSYWADENSLFHIKSLIIDRKHIYLWSANFQSAP